MACTETTRQRIHLGTIAPLALFLLLARTTTIVTGAPALLQQTDLQYAGAFRLPAPQSEQRSFAN